MLFSVLFVEYRLRLFYGLIFIILDIISISNCQRPNFAGLRPPDGLTQKDKYLLNSLEPALEQNISAAATNTVSRQLLTSENQTSTNPQVQFAVAQSLSLNPLLPPKEQSHNLLPNPNGNSIAFSVLQTTERTPVTEPITEVINFSVKEHTYPPLDNRFINNERLPRPYIGTPSIQTDIAPNPGLGLGLGLGHTPFYKLSPTPFYPVATFPTSKPLSTFHHFPPLVQDVKSVSRTVFSIKPNIAQGAGFGFKPTPYHFVPGSSGFDTTPEFRQEQGFNFETHVKSDFESEEKSLLEEDSELGSGSGSDRTSFRSKSLKSNDILKPIPVDARGDRQLVEYLSRLPIDQRPFWLLNHHAIESQRNFSNY